MKVYYHTLSLCPNANVASWPTIRESIPNCEEVELEEADVIIAFFCAMTIDEIQLAKTELEELIKFKREHRRVRLIVGGCLQSVNRLRENYKEVYDLLCTNEIDCLFSREAMVEDILSFLGFRRKPLVPISFIDDAVAVIQIASGCNRKCSFCKSWYLDMPYRFLPMEVVMDAVDSAVKLGATRLDITGENITEYDTDCSGRSQLIVLLKRIIREFPSIKIINLSGIALDEMDEYLFRFILNQPKIRAIQLEVQSLDQNVRRAMGLTKSVGDAMRMVTELSKEHNVRSSIMAGHPGETTEGVYRQLRLINDNNMYYLEPNKYINTPQTRSYGMEQISEEMVTNHLTLMLGTIVRLRARYVAGVLGKTIPMYVVGMASDYHILLPVGGTIRVTVRKMDGIRIGDYVNCYIDSYKPWGSGSGQSIEYQRRQLMSVPLDPVIMMSLLSPVDNEIYLGGQIK